MASKQEILTVISCVLGLMVLVLYFENYSANKRLEHIEAQYRRFATYKVEDRQLSSLLKRNSVGIFMEGERMFVCGEFDRLKSKGWLKR